MQKQLDSQNENIQSVMEYNEALGEDKEKLQQQLIKLKEEHEAEKLKLQEALEKEKGKRKDILTSLDTTDADKVRTSQRLVTQDKEMDRMHMLYRQIASEKAALNREKELLAEKLEKKRQKHVETKQVLEEVTKQFEEARDHNAQIEKLISQVMGQIKSGGVSTASISDFRQSL